MEISELLRRGNFNRSQIFLSNQQLSQQSLELDGHSNLNCQNSKSPPKPQLQSKSSMNYTRITDHSNTSQIGKEQQYYLNKKQAKDYNKVRSQRSSQFSLNEDQSEFMNYEGKKYSHKIQTKSMNGLNSLLKSEQQLTHEIDQEQQQNEQTKIKPTHQKNQSQQYSISQRNKQSNEIYPKSQEGRRNVISKSLEQDKLRDLLTKTINFKSSNQELFKKNLNGVSAGNIKNIGTFNKRIISDIFSSSTLNELQKSNQQIPQTTKQNLFSETLKSTQPFFKGFNQETFKKLTQSALNNQTIQKEEDNKTKDLQQNSSVRQLSPQKKILNSILESDKKQELKINQHKLYRSQEKYTGESTPSKRINFEVYPFSTTHSTKNIILKNNKVSSELIQSEQKMRQTIKGSFAENEMKLKPYNLTRSYNQFNKHVNKSQEMEDNGVVSDSNQKATGVNNCISSILGVVRMKKKVNELVKRNQEKMEKKNQQRSDESDSDYEVRRQSIKDRSKFSLHNKIVQNLKKEEGCEIHDIYGTFNDKIKQIQEQVFESLHNYSLAQTVIEQLDKEKKQSRVIDAVENTICSIFMSLDYLEKIPSIMNEREEIDKILAQQAISLMKSTQSNLVIQIETVLIYAKYCKAISNFGKALRLYKQCKNMSISPLMQRYRMKSYKSIGQCFQNLKLYTTSLLYFGKYLECAWYLGDTEAELKAYDLLGVTHYLLGDLETAKFYHEKMIQNDNEPPESDVRTLNAKKMVEKLKKLNTEEYIQKMAVSYKKFFAKVHSIDYEEDYECSSSDDEFKITIPKTSSQKKNQEYDDYMRDLSPLAKKKLDSEKKRFIAIFNAEDRIAQKTIKKQANQNIRMLEYKRAQFQLPSQLKFSSAQSFKPINNTQKTPFRINQFSINRNLDNYMAQDQRILKNQNFDFFKLVEDNNDKKLKHKIIYILSKFQNNLIFALSQIHQMRERDKYKQNKRRFAFSGVADFNKPNNLILMNINISQEEMRQHLEEKKKIKQIEDKSKPNSNKQKFLFIQRYQMHPEIEAILKK